MGLLITATLGIAVWIVTWSMGFKSFDGFLVGGILVLLAATAHILVPSLPGTRPEE